uniref:Pre-mRNA-splicing factor CLF1 (Crooked-neck-like protein 1) n=1 Tax=Ganoderma boninense TaxID=34458 RepID=A0A5K1K7H1_9APHY|nr:Pre-mRNA-splicing factor CLF1 (crooked-neck-like protein 1) [Ganoderma boninense]
MFPPSGADDADSLIPDTDVKEPPLKKFKALFDESDPDRVARMDMSEYASQHVGSPPGGESLTQYEPSAMFATQASRSGTNGRSGVNALLLPVMEEEEEGTVVSETQTQGRGTKRKTQDEDVDMDDEHPRLKRRTGVAPVEQSQAPPPPEQNQAQKKPMSKVVTRVDMAQTQVHVKPPKPSSSKKGTQAGPDRDDAFLKAVASTKRGKKSEDTFDREFNNLRISKPDLERAREDEEWKVLEEFGDDGDVRGNFMVVVECPVFREAGTNTDHMRRGEGRAEWVGRPDFKKFKKRTAGERRQPIELLVEEQSDLGIGSQYWKGSQPEPPSQPLPESQSQQPKIATTQRSAPRNGKERLLLHSDSDAEEKPAVAKSTKGKGRAPSAKPPSTQKSTVTRATRGKTSSQKQPLFILDSDDEEEDAVKDDDFRMDSDDEDEPPHDAEGDDDDDDDEFGATLKSLKSTGRSSRTATQASSKGKSGTGTAAAKKKTPAIVVDDDSDDGGFKAFGARTRTRRK